MLQSMGSQRVRHNLVTEQQPNKKYMLIAKAILRKRRQNRRNNLPRLQTILQATVTKIQWYWHKTRHMDQWNRIESPEINPHTNGQLIFHKGGKNIQWGKR